MLQRALVIMNDGKPARIVFVRNKVLQRALYLFGLNRPYCLRSKKVML